MYHAVKAKVHSLLHPEYGDTKLDKTINAIIIVLIILNVIAVMLETVPSIHEEYMKFFEVFDLVSVIIFTVEYVFRVWSSNHETKYRHSFHGRLKYMLTPGALIDLVAILPYYLHAVVGLDLRVLRILRLFRFLRLFRLTAYMKSAKIVRNVFVSKASDLKLSLLLILFLIIISASLVYFAEHNAQPDLFSSIPKTFWWAVVTVTTVGYGDMIPVTMAGQLLTGVIALAGIALFALPAGIITAGFLEETRKIRQSKGSFCPHCGESLENNGHHSYEDKPL